MNSASPSGSPMINILNSLPGPKKLEMQNLLARLKAGQLELQEFLTQTKNLLGNRLYSDWIAANKAATTPTPSQTPRLPVRPPSAPGAFLAPMHQHEGASSMPSLSNLDAQQQDDELISYEEHRQMSQSQRFSGAASGNTQTTDDGGVDVTRMDTASLQDVIQYSGIDLKEEAENILRGHEGMFMQSSFGANASNSVLTEDLRSTYDYYLNMAHLKERISRHCKRHNIRAFHDDCMYIVAFAMKERLSRTIEAAHAVSKHRTEYHRLRFKIKVENDPLKQVWVLQKHLKDLYPTKELSASSTPLGQQQQQPQQQQPQQIPSSPATLSPIDPFDSRGAKKMKKAPNAAATASKTASTQSKDREDVAIKTKLANVTANLALGIQQKSWMSLGGGAGGAGGNSVSGFGAASGAGGMSSSMSSALGMGGSAGFGKTNTWKSNIPLPFSANSTEKDIANLIANRTITVQDLLFVMEGDAYLSKSATYFTVMDSGK